MANRVQLNDDSLDLVVGGNLTYEWYGGLGKCGLNNNHKWSFTNKTEFESFMKECMIEKGMSDVDTLKAMVANGIIWK